MPRHFEVCRKRASPSRCMVHSRPMKYQELATAYRGQQFRHDCQGGVLHPRPVKYQGMATKEKERTRPLESDRGCLHGGDNCSSSYPLPGQAWARKVTSLGSSTALWHCTQNALPLAGQILVKAAPLAHGCAGGVCRIMLWPDGKSSLCWSSFSCLFTSCV